MKNELIKSYFNILGGKKENEREFYILENKKSKRGMIFQKRNRKAIRFMKDKLDSPIKKILYFFLTLGLAQIFLRKIKLDASLGQLVFIGGQTKIFDFKNKKVASFQRKTKYEENFIKTKKNQMKLSQKGFAPIIFKLNEKIPFSIEELLEEKKDLDDKIIFKKLLKYYGTQKMKRISYSSYIKKLKKKSFFEELPESLKKELEKIKNKKGFFYLCKIHGDFGKEQILLRKKEIIFTDWQTEEDLILMDLFNFYRKEKNLFKNGNFISVLELFPKKITKNLRDYFTVFQAKLYIIKKAG